MSYTTEYISEASQILGRLDVAVIDRMVALLGELRERGGRLTAKDMVFVLSVGGGDLERNISPNLVRALEYARSIDVTICGIVGRNGGYTAQVADACVIVPPINPETITPHAEAFQAVIWHLMVSHPALRATEMKWESTR